MVLIQGHIDTVSMHKHSDIVLEFDCISSLILINAMIFPPSHGFYKITLDVIIEGKKERFMNYFDSEYLHFNWLDEKGNISGEAWIFCLKQFKVSILDYHTILIKNS